MQSIIFWKLGRSVFFAEYPSSSNIWYSSMSYILQYSFNFLRCNGRLSLSTWYLVETRTYKAAFRLIWPGVWPAFFLGMVPPFPGIRKKAQKRKPIDFYGFPCYNLFAYYQQEAAFSVCLVLEVGRCLQTPINFFFYVVFIISLFVTQVPAGCGFHLSKSLFFRFGKVHVRHHQNKVLASWKCFF